MTHAVTVEDDLQVLVSTEQEATEPLELAIGRPYETTLDREHRVLVTDGYTLANQTTLPDGRVVSIFTKVI